EKVSVFIDSQSGKTTVAKILLGLTDFQSGEVNFLSNKLESVDIEHRNIAYISGRLLFFDKKSVYYNLSYPLQIRKIADIPQRVKEQAEKFNLLSQLKTTVNALSAKDKVNLLLARATIRNADLFIIDDVEKFDKESYNAILEYALTLTSTVVILTSNIEQSTDNIIMVYDGKTERVTKEEVIRRISSDEILWLYDKTKEQC
ncbi:MAG: ATP-binding cassette domain-containing protein, partial [Clostridia bacterium]